MITVVAAYIEKDGKFLIAQRTTGNPELLGKWEFPGGKVEADETEEEAIEREIKEELDIVVKAYDYMCHTLNETIDLKLYRCAYRLGDIKLHDHNKYAWVTTSTAKDYDLAPNDKALLRQIEDQ